MIKWILLLPLVIVLAIFIVSWIFFNANQLGKINYHDWVGKTGVAGTSIDDKYGGIVYLDDKTVMAKSYCGEIERGSIVLLVAYDKENKHYKVEKYS